MMNTTVLTTVVAVVGFGLSPSPAMAMAIDAQAGEVWRIIGRVLADRHSPGRLTEQEAALIAEGANQRRIPDLEMAATYGLGLMTDSASAEKLQKLLNDPWKHVSDTARFALLLRELLSRPPATRLSRMADELARPHGHYTRLFLANWLGAEFDDDVLPVFVEGLKKETDNFVRSEYFFQLSRSKNMVFVDKAINALEAEPRWDLPEDTQYILQCLRPGSAGRESVGPDGLLRFARKAKEALQTKQP